MSLLSPALHPQPPSRPAQLVCLSLALGCGAATPTASPDVIREEPAAQPTRIDEEASAPEAQSVPDQPLLSTTGSVYWIVEEQPGAYHCVEYHWVHDGDRLTLEHDLPEGRISYRAHVEGNQITLTGPRTFLPNESTITGCMQYITVHTITETHWITRGAVCTRRGPPPFWYLSEQACLETIAN